MTAGSYSLEQRAEKVIYAEFLRRDAQENAEPEQFLIGYAVRDPADGVVKYHCHCKDCNGHSRQPFKESADLNRHSYLHLDKIYWKFVCDMQGCECGGKAFIQKSNLDNHKKKMRGERFRCKFTGCNKDLLTPTALTLHRKRDHDRGVKTSRQMGGRRKNGLAQNDASTHTRSSSVTGSSMSSFSASNSTVEAGPSNATSSPIYSEQSSHLSFSPMDPRPLSSSAGLRVTFNRGA
ncbi:hypothetical protein C8Q75DRAFT_786795 [Abortiporus biennis]|nr:hypothetical protein C8Q75DRAFT_786795 [Abortiporus biennis]